MKFTEFELHPDLLKGIEEAGFEECMPVQAETFSHSFAGKDVAVQSQTGTGKSATFIISIFNIFLQNKTGIAKRALIVAPTRELAVQIGKEAELLGKYLNFKIGVFYGGTGYTKQERQLKEGVEIIIGTPGRLIDFSQSGKLNLKEVGILVVDETDRLFDMGFLPDIRRILRKMPTYPNRQTMLFSATLDTRVKNIASEYMHESVEIEIESDQVTVENISQQVYHIARNEKLSILIGILRRDNPYNAIIFTNTKQMAERVSNTLNANGFDSKFLTGDLPQSKRLRIIDNFKNGKLPLLIATDVASRGLHIEDLELVVNYDLPENTESYVHRIGRTARVGKSGTAISLVCEQFVYGLEDIESYIQMQIPVASIEDDLFAKVIRPSHTHSVRQQSRSKTKTNSKKKSTARKKAPANKNNAAANNKTETKGSEKKKTNTKSPVKSPAKSPASKKKADTAVNKNNTVKQSKQLRPKKKKKTSLEDRLEYYSEKYGDNFTKVDGNVPVKKSSSGITGKLKSLFKRKN